MLLSIALCLMGAPVHAQQPRSSWYKGNTHTHTINSDGNATPDVVVRWYREHGYQFVVITDHEYLTDVTPLNALFGRDGQFLVIRGQEVSQWMSDPEHRWAHVNAINSKSVVYPVGETRCLGRGCGRVASLNTPLANTFTTNIANVSAAGGVAQVNHPNVEWSVRPEDLFGVPDQTLLEIWNVGDGSNNNLGGTDDEGHIGLSTEALWDVLLTRGKVIWGVASDDSHAYYHLDERQLADAPPGQAWISVRAESLTPETITGALRRGEFYASNGVVLDNYDVTAADIAITIKPETKDTRYLTRFIGKNGRIFAESPGLKPHYHLKGDEGYVRASIIDSNGRRAWTQPVFVH